MFRVLPGSHSLSERELSLLATFAEPSDGPDPYDASVVSSLAEMEDVDKFAVNAQAIPGCRRLPVEFPGVELEIGPGLRVNRGPRGSLARLGKTARSPSR